MDVAMLGRTAYYVLRVLHMFINNVMAIPAYIVWYLVLTPLRKLCPNLFWQVERVLFKALLSFVVMWAYSGGYRSKKSNSLLSA